MRRALLGVLLTGVCAATLAAAEKSSDIGGRLDQLMAQPEAATAAPAEVSEPQAVLCRFQEKDMLPPPPGASTAVVSDAPDATDSPLVPVPSTPAAPNPPAASSAASVPGVPGVPVGNPGEPVKAEKKAETPTAPLADTLPPAPGEPDYPRERKPGAIKKAKPGDDSGKPNPFTEESSAGIKEGAISHAAPGDTSCCPDADNCCDDECEYRLFHSRWMDDNRIDVRGWLDQGYTFNPANPADRFNGPIGYNDRSDEYQLNQIYLIGERLTKTDCCHRYDIGGRVDVLFGTDSRFVRSTPGTGFDSAWDTGRFYGFAMPQLYADLAINNLIIRGGHFLYPCGLESVMAPENFFYSHTYSFLYGQPTTFTGGELIYKVNDRFSVLAGLDTGWNNFDDPNGKVGFFAGFNWTSKDERTKLNYVLSINNQQPTGVDSTRTQYCLCLTRQLNDNLSVGIEHDLGVDSFSAAAGTDAEWFSVVPYLTYQFNSCWAVGLRYEWFRDDEGVILNPPSDPFVGVPGDWNDVALGVKYTPNKNVMIRSEVRYDWLNAAVPVVQEPFDDHTKNFQWTWGTDLILKF